MEDLRFAPLFNYLHLFKNISRADADVIAAQIGHREVKSGEVLIREGSIAKEMFFICKGILKIETTNEKGGTVVQFFLKENQFCTILNSLINNIPAYASIVAACDCELIVFSRDKLNHLYQAIAYFKELIDSITKQSLIDKIDLRNMYMGEDATTRYRQFMLRQPEIALRVPLSDIASYLGITQQSLSRIRRTAR